MKINKWFIVAVVILAIPVLASCAQNQTASDQLSDAERAEIAAEIKQRNQDLLAAWAQEDAFDAWMALHADENHPSWVEDRCLLTLSGASYGSQAEMDAAFRAMLSDRTTQVTMKDEFVAVLSANHAVHFGDFTWSVTRNGVTSEEFLGTATTIWTLEGDEWKILHYHQSWPSTTPVPAK
jgi:outer membrane murein-binding lipoprotein Lpp